MRFKDIVPSFILVIFIVVVVSVTFIQNSAAADVEADAYSTQYLPGQAWLPEIRQRFYFTAQGSKIIPYDWAMAIYAADGKTPFFSSQNLQKYGYIPQKKSAQNLDGLPVGFMRDQNPGGFTRGQVRSGNLPPYSTAPQLGINCAACHTSELSFRGLKLRIDGGPSYSNFQMFTQEMDEAINAVASLNQPGEANSKAFLDFASRYFKLTLGKSWAALPPAEQVRRVNLLRVNLAQFNETRQQWQQNNGRVRAGITYGPGRNDAFGVIFNQALGAFLNLPANVRPANAPVKYPVIWDAPFHDQVQWIGIARNSPDAGGPIARNIGQVLGVFGHSDVNDQSLIHGYCTSAKRQELTEIEDWVRTLRSPTWPIKIPGFAFDVERAKRGQSHFQKYCVGCHALNERSPEEARLHYEALGIKDFFVSQKLTGTEKRAHEKMIPIDGANGVQTDPLTAQNAYSREAFTGALAGRPLKVVMGRPMESTEPAASVLRHVVAGSILGSFSYISCANTPRDGMANLGLAKRFLDKELGFTPADSDPGNLQARMELFRQELSKYKARPLNGIWAAPPFLHNGSVRSLKQLLTPPAQREHEFQFDCNEFDPVEVGLNCSAQTITDANRVFYGQFKYDTQNIRGNSNQGHDFGTGLSEVEKMELIEYIGRNESNATYILT